MSYSKQQLIALALSKHGIPGAGQTPSAEDVATVDQYINTVMSDLAQRDIWQWGDPDQIDDAAALHLAAILANACAADFDQPADEKLRLLAETRLRALNVTTLSGQRQTTEYF